MRADVRVGSKTGKALCEQKSFRFSPNGVRQSGHKPASGHLFDQNLLPHLKIFLQKRLPQKGYPLSGAEPFLDRFLGEGA